MAGSPRPLFEAIGIVLIVSFLNLGVASRTRGRALPIPLVLAIVFIVMQAMESACSESRSARSSSPSACLSMTR